MKESVREFCEQKNEHKPSQINIAPRETTVFKMVFPGTNVTEIRDIHREKKDTVYLGNDFMIVYPETEGNDEMIQFDLYVSNWDASNTRKNAPLHFSQMSCNKKPHHNYNSAAAAEIARHKTCQALRWFLLGERRENCCSDR